MNKILLSTSFFLVFTIFSVTGIHAQKTSPLVVSADGVGSFSTIQAAINSLPDTSATSQVIYIKNGVYREKLFIAKSNLILKGESKDSTRLIFAVARDEWRCANSDDWGAATLNIGASDITLQDLTITNDYGFSEITRTISCINDTALTAGTKIIKKDGHQMAVRVMNMATRFKAFNCRFISYGGDTMSPWEINNGMWFFKNCSFEGGVDFYCPRGWAWAENCDFYAHNGPAAIWHDGSGNIDSKSVFMNCRFDGYNGFLLGRYHREAQFYLVGCIFSSHMKDASIYPVPTATPLVWGHRVYFFNCHREGGKDYLWHQDNLPLSVKPSEITTEWLFGTRWSPAKN